MKNIIAIIWDFDKTLVNGYMQDPIFQDYNINAHDFGTEVNALPKKLHEDDRIDMFAEADYSEGTTAYMWICNKVKEFAENIKAKEKSKRSGNYAIPTHLV